MPRRNTTTKRARSRHPEPLAQLEGKRLGRYTLRLADVSPGSKSGWLSFRLVVTGPKTLFSPPVIEGVYSPGGRGVTPWIEIIEYHPRQNPAQGKVDELDLAATALDRELFRHVGALIPRGGHLMVACEGPEHEATYRLLMRRVPPAVTPLGYVLFASGFHSVRFFYLAEGGWEGQQKLWAEKARDTETEQRWRETLARDLLRFLREPDNAAYAALCAARTLLVMTRLKPAGPFSDLLATILRECGPHVGTEPQRLVECTRRLSAQHPDL